MFAFTKCIQNVSPAGRQIRIAKPESIKSSGDEDAEGQTVNPIHAPLTGISIRKQQVKAERERVAHENALQTPQSEHEQRATLNGISHAVSHHHTMNEMKVAPLLDVQDGSGSPPPESDVHNVARCLSKPQA
ncbi:hypothetical protein BCT27_13650 [Enterovibrio norvegicus]|nr:hypothetical protein BCT27_13650 [Enterovibrio norvegicus]